MLATILKKALKRPWKLRPIGWEFDYNKIYWKRSVSLPDWRCLGQRLLFFLKISGNILSIPSWKTESHSSSQDDKDKMKSVKFLANSFPKGFCFFHKMYFSQNVSNDYHYPSNSIGIYRWFTT